MDQGTPQAQTTPPQVGDTWYRFEDVQYADFDSDSDYHGPGRLDVRKREYVVKKVTPKGVWLGKHVAGFECDVRFVLLNSRKQYASPTKEAALDAFIARKTRQASILSAQLARANNARAIAEMLKDPAVATSKLRQIFSLA